jgi:hypothetical protein
MFKSHPYGKFVKRISFATGRLTSNITVSWFSPTASWRPDISDMTIQQAIFVRGINSSFNKAQELPAMSAMELYGQLIRTLKIRIKCKSNFNKICTVFMECTKNPTFMALSKTGVIMNQYCKIPKLPYNFQCKSPPPVKRFMVCTAESIYGFM